MTAEERAKALADELCLPWTEEPEDIVAIVNSINAAVAEEREECAKLVAQWPRLHSVGVALSEAAAAIRARGQG